VSDIGAANHGILGKEAKPPFAVLPNPSSLFLTRSQRLITLAPQSQLEPYLSFLSVVTRAQHDIQPALPAVSLPSFDRIAQALDHGMPPLSRTLSDLSGAAQVAVDCLLDRIPVRNVPPATSAAIQNLRAAPFEQRQAMMAAALDGSSASETVAEAVLLLAGLQVHFARMAAMLNAQDLKLIAEAVCPACGSAPMSSSVVGWPMAHNTRFCTCSLCGTMWNVVRVKCLLCSSTESINFRSIEGERDTIKAETCDKCRGYVKILYQVHDHNLEPLVDDVATLGLDMLLAEEGWKRGGRNPFLMGY
jgi:FdhE protein